MKRLTERAASISSERLLQSVHAVMARMTDVVWQADAAGAITNVTLCRPSLTSGDGELDETEIQRVERLWSRCVRCAERFSAAFHVRRPGTSPRTFHLEAVPVLDRRDAVLYWAGSCAEIDRFSDAGSLFVSEAAAVLSSSLSRATIVNRLVEASVDHFCDVCVVHLFDDDGALQREGVADHRPNGSTSLEGIERALYDATRSREPQLLLSTALGARSMIVVPLFAGRSCIGTLSFLEAERSSSFAAQDVDIGVIVGRQLAMALENIKTFEREQSITERFRFMARVTDRLFETLDQPKLLGLVLDGLCDGFADYGVAAELHGKRLRVVAGVGTNARFRDTAEREIVAALQKRRSLQAGKIADVSRGTRLRAGPLSEDSYPQSWMMVPLFLGETVYGALVCCSNDRSYDSGELELLAEIGRRVSLALEHAESFARERRLIQTLQQATLPTRLAPVKGASLSAIYRPAAIEVQVGGDWYDAYDLDEHRVLLTVGDVTGHGLEASIVMGKLRHAINVVAMYEPDPVQILNAAERVLLRRYPGSVATAFVAIFDARTRLLTYANAGHPYPILRRRDGSLQELKADGLPIGLRFAGPSAKPTMQRIDDATLLALYTDGLTEATRDMLAGERRLAEALSTDAIFYVENPAEFVERFCLRGPSRDDVAVLLLNFVGALRWTFDSSERRTSRFVRREILSNLAAWAQPGDDVKAVELIFGELAANVAQHAGGRMDVALESRNGRAVLHVIDRGEGSLAPSGGPDLLTEHGRGLWLIQRLGAQLSIEVLPGYGNHVVATLPTRLRTPPV
jgi:GAF domain-containing protein/anti-sigma regulatory factor (Ser/Thr protein kinase)